jgi:menaquinone-dependent protoporphyrinogen oxidase
MTRVLVIHAGDTRDAGPVADGIVTAATAAGATARVAGSTVGGPLNGWDLVVIGAPLRHGRWHRDAHRFLRRHCADLESVPVAVFGVADVRTDDAWQRNRAALDRALERHGWLVPLEVTLFDAPSTGTRAVSGFADWQAVGDWARKLVAVAGPG